MKKIIVALLIIFLSACSGSPPGTKEPKGNWVQINSSHYYQENAKPTINKDK